MKYYYVCNTKDFGSVVGSALLSNRTIQAMWRSSRIFLVSRRGYDTSKLFCSSDNQFMVCAFLQSLLMVGLSKEYIGPGMEVSEAADGKLCIVIEEFSEDLRSVMIHFRYFS
jgi:hypothetical protein